MLTLHVNGFWKDEMSSFGHMDLVFMPCHDVLYFNLWADCNRLALTIKYSKVAFTKEEDSVHSV